MDQEQVTIQYLDKNIIIEANFMKDYNIIMQELTEKENVKWVLFDNDTGNPIDEVNIINYENLMAFRAIEIPEAFYNQQQVTDITKDRDDWKKKFLDQEQQLNDSHILQQQYLPLKAIEESKLKKKCINLEQTIQQLKEKLEHYYNQYMTEKVKAIRLQNTNIASNDKMVKLQTNNKLLSSQKSNLEADNKQISEYMVQLENKSTLQQHQFSEQSQEIIDKTMKLENQLLEKEQQITYLQKVINDQNIKLAEFSKLTNQLTNQNKFLESILKKYLDDVKMNRIRITEMRRQLTNIQYSELQVQLITLNEHEFLKSIKDKNFFFRENCLDKLTVIESAVNQDYMIALINEKKVNIKKVCSLQNFEHEGLDYILNILIVQGYFKLFLSHLQQINNEKCWNLKIPRQFLIKNKKEHYYVYEECLEINYNIFKAFQNTTKVDQFISSFFTYFFFATNKNFALTECQFGEQGSDNQDKELVIQKIFIHSHYDEGYSTHDKGKIKIEEFEQMIQAPGGTNLMYWSNELQNLAQQVWNGQQQQ